MFSRHPGVAEQSPAPAPFLHDLLVLIAVALATDGLYGAVAHLVSGKRQETGIRLALGAEGI
jgi:hypothetical protein